MSRKAPPIRIFGARENNLRNIDLEIPRYSITVLTGLSGSGKSSLALDTLFAEGQRRYVESLSSQARQLLGELGKPDVDLIEGLSPAVAVTQHSTQAGPRSTVGTISEIGNFLRLLYARLGELGEGSQGFHLDRKGILERLKGLEEDSSLTLFAPVLEERKGAQKRLLDRLRKSGIVRVRLNGEVVDLDDLPSLPAQQRNSVDAVVDRILLREKSHKRLSAGLDRALALGSGRVRILCGKEEWTFSLASAERGSLPKLSPGLFSFNSRSGACPACQGMGTQMKLSESLLIRDESLSLEKGAIDILKGARGSWLYVQVEALANALDFSMKVPYSSLSRETRRLLLYGNGEKGISIELQTPRGRRSRNYEGLLPYLERRYRETSSTPLRKLIEKAMAKDPCPECKGQRLGAEALRVRLGGLNFAELSSLSLDELLPFFDRLGFSGARGAVASEILPEIRSRLGFLRKVGLGYLSLNRRANTLSGGERQRLSLAEQVGTSMTGVLYILDEPSIGLHLKDHHALLDTLHTLRDRGNTILLVEHDRETMERADWIIDLGPGAGEHGGNVVAQGSLEDLRGNADSPTGRCLSEDTGEFREPRELPSDFLEVRGARQHNLKGLRVRFPLARLSCVSGVSGSGKSSLVHDVLYATLSRDLCGSTERPGLCDEVLGSEHLGDVIHVNQAPIGRSPRSNPATFSGAWGVIRDLFASLPESRLRGYGPGRFSFNIKGGRCETCKGEGQRKVTLHFLPPAFVPCEQCRGKRFNRETREIHYRGKNISEVLDMTIEQALDHFSEVPKVASSLGSLRDVGLSYLRLGQSATSLSGGEAQRLKIAKELGRRNRSRTLYILDEPSTGLHFEDVRTLMGILHRLVDRGHSVIIIEHNPDIIREADWLVDLGPEGGPQGGGLVYEGPPRGILDCPESHTGKILLSREEDRRTS